MILLATFVLAGVAIFTAVRLYQLRQQPVAPNVPSSIPRAAEIPGSCSALAFTLSSASPSPTPSGTASPTPTGSSTPNPSGTPNACGGTCGSNSNCASNLICYQSFCRNPSCTTSTNCVCSGTPNPTATPPTLPQSGTDWPTTVGAGIGILTIIGSLLLAF